MASCSAFVQLSEDQFQCSICLDVFTDPVSTPCGHNFCRTCLTTFWNDRRTYQCPLCKEEFPHRPELRVNTFVSGLILQFKESLHIKHSSPSKKPTAEYKNVPCDVCTDPKVEALKSCLDCGTSFCEEHIEHHKTAAKLKKHTLINPVKNLDDYICQKHGKAIELFCRDDQTCVCLFCNETDHKNHNTVLIEEESGQRKAQIKETQASILEMIQGRIMKVKELNDSLDLKKIIADIENAQSTEVLKALILSIERSQAEFLGVMEEKKKAAERQAEGFTKVLEKEISQLKRKDTELGVLSQTEDNLYIVQNYLSNTLSTLPHTNDWTNIHIKTEESRESLRMALLQLQAAVNKELEKIPETSLDTQKADIQQLLKTPLVEGDTWYLVDSNWFHQWKTFVDFDSQNTDQGVCDFYPGPVNNLSLLKDTDPHSIKKDLLAGVHYVLLPTEGWCKLISWYGLVEGQKPIARKVVLHRVFLNKKVEVYPSIWKLCTTQ